MKKKKKAYSWLRSFSTTQEKRMWYAHKDNVHIRGRRSPRMLPDAWDEYSECIQKTWKVKREKQYYGRSDLNKYIIDLNPYDYEFYLTQYFEDQEISYKINKNNRYVPESIAYWHHTEIQKKYIDKLLKCRRFY